MMYVIGIDPANETTAYSVCDLETMRPVWFGRKPNQEALNEIIEHALELIYHRHDVTIAIEGIQSYGNPVGQTTFQTCYWIGYMQAVFDNYEFKHCLIYRSEERTYICHNSRAKDSMIIAALTEEFAPTTPNHGKGSKTNPGFFYGFKRDIWQSFAVARTFKYKLEEQQWQQ